MREDITTFLHNHSLTKKEEDILYCVAFFLYTEDYDMMLQEIKEFMIKDKKLSPRYVQNCFRWCL